MKNKYQTSEIVYFDPQKTTEYPYFGKVDKLLGGLETIMFPDGTEQIAWKSQYPDIVFSPRLKIDDLELFLKENLVKYEQYSKENSELILEGSEPLPPINMFWIDA